MTKYIADAAVFIMGNCPISAADMITISSVEDEMRSSDASLRYDIAKAEGLRVEAAEERFAVRIRDQAAQTRDIEKLSATDIGVLAKALEYQEVSEEEVILITDDFAVQNIAVRLGIAVLPVAQRVIENQIVWQKQCIGCHRHFKDGNECPVCGSPLRKKMKKKTRRKSQTV